MTRLPAVALRPLLDAYADAIDPALTASAASRSMAAQSAATQSAAMQSAATQSAAAHLLEQDLDGGVPALLVLDAARSLVLSVPVGVARPLVDADPLAVVVDTARATPTGLTQPADLPRPRLTLLVGGIVGTTAAVLPGVPLLLGVGGRAEVCVLVERLVVTAGALRSPGRFDARIRLRWNDVTRAGDVGAAPVTADPALALLGRAAR